MTSTRFSDSRWFVKHTFDDSLIFAGSQRNLIKHFSERATKIFDLTVHVRWLPVMKRVLSYPAPQQKCFKKQMYPLKSLWGYSERHSRLERAQLSESRFMIFALTICTISMLRSSAESRLMDCTTSSAYRQSKHLWNIDCLALLQFNPSWCWVQYCVEKPIFKWIPWHTKGWAKGFKNA